jgi:ABC-type multidrug transport system ATPase subunit
MSNAIELFKVVKEFGPKKALNEVTLEIPEGAVFGLIGPNGAGKTTAFSILSGYLQPTSGSARVLGADPTDVAALKGKLGVLPQDAMLPATETVGAFLLYLARLQGLTAAEASKASREVLALVGGDDWWTQRCGKLSHGMAKRVGIAQALLGAPKVVFFDEPTAGLDPRVAYGVRQVIKSLTGKCTVIVSSHNLQELEEVCDRAAILDHGKVVASGTMSELTAATKEFSVEIAPFAVAPAGSGADPYRGSGLEAAIKAIAGVTTVHYEPGSGRLTVGVDATHDVDVIVAHTLRALLDGSMRIRSLARGRSLEQRVMELT